MRFNNVTFLGWWFTFVRRIGTRIQSSDDVTWVRRGLAVAAIEGGRSDYEATTASLILLRYGAELHGINIDSLYRQIQEPEFLAPENKPLFESARTCTTAEIAAAIKSAGPPGWQVGK